MDLPLSFKGDVIREFFGRPASTGTGPTGTDHGRAGHARPIARDSRLAMDGGQRAVSSWPPDHPHFGSSEAVGLAKVMLSRHLICVGGTEVTALEREFAAMYGSPIVEVDVR